MKVGDIVSWFDIGPMRRYTGTVVQIVSATIVKVQIEGRQHPTTVFACDIEAD